MILLGNLKLEDIEKRIGFKFPEDIREYMKANHQQEAKGIKKGCWHCFDMPFNIVCGDVETAEKIFNSIKDRVKEVKEKIYFSIEEIEQ